MEPRSILSVLLELAASGLVLYSTLNPDINLLAAAWLALWKASQATARAAGRVAMRAELRYFAIVKL
jgi:hypothetical protein